MVHATYYASSKQHPPADKANLIVPLSTLANDTGNDASVPPGFSVRRSDEHHDFILMIRIAERHSPDQYRGDICRALRIR